MLQENLVKTPLVGEEVALGYAQQFNINNFKGITLNILSHPILKSSAAVVSLVAEWLFGAHLEALMVVFALICFDTITGLTVALKFKTMNSRGFFRFAAKLAIYLILMGTASLVDRALPFNLSAPIMFTFLAITEAMSVLENVRLLGWPVPAQVVSLLRKTRGNPTTATTLNKEEDNK